MNASIQQAIKKAMTLLSRRNIFKLGNEEFEVRTIFLIQSWQPHIRPCSQANSLVLGEDSCGNFFLYLPNGSVSFWDHETEKEIILARTVEQFCDSLIEPSPVTLNPGQIKNKKINPMFFEELKKKGKV